MEQWEITKLIRETVKAELAAQMMGKVTASASSQRATARRFANETPIPNQRLISPYGLASRPKAGTECVIGAVNNDPSHLSILGCNDITRPDLEEGETALYGADGQLIFLKAGGTIHQGSKAATEPVVLGNVAKEFLRNWISLLIETDPIAFDSFGLPVVLTPAVKLQLTAWRLQYLDTPATNILGQKNFVERGA